MRVWDTAGMERFHTLNRTFYKKADAIVLCYDTTNQASFTNLENWTKSIDLYA